MPPHRYEYITFFASARQLCQQKVKRVSVLTVIRLFDIQLSKLCRAKRGFLYLIHTPKKSLCVSLCVCVRARDSGRRCGSIATRFCRYLEYLSSEVRFKNRPYRSTESAETGPKSSHVKSTEKKFALDGAAVGRSTRKSKAVVQSPPRAGFFCSFLSFTYGFGRGILKAGNMI